MDNSSADNEPNGLATDTNNVVFFDGVCNLCNASVQFIIHHDRKGIFRFASLQSDIARQMLGQQVQTGNKDFETILFRSKGKVYAYSDAVLRIASLLPFPWKLATVFKFIPRFIRDKVYLFISRNRYRWFGKKEQCMIPTPELRKRFLHS